MLLQALPGTCPKRSNAYRIAWHHFDASDGPFGACKSQHTDSKSTAVRLGLRVNLPGHVKGDTTCLLRSRIKIDDVMFL